MTAYVLPLAATAAAFGLTYVFCVRPMSTGRTCHSPVADQPLAADAEIGVLREEVRRLRREVGTRTGIPEPLAKGDPR